MDCGMFSDPMLNFYLSFSISYFSFFFFFLFLPPPLPTPFSFYFIVPRVEINELSLDNDEHIGKHKNTQLLVPRPGYSFTDNSP